jgi:hypothetical protein
MHLSDTLVIGPLPLQTRTVRMPVGMALAIGAATLAAITAVAAGSAPQLLDIALAPVAARLGVAIPVTAATPVPVGEGAQVEVHLASVPAGAAIVLDGQVVGMTPATITTTVGKPLVLRRPGAPDVVVLDPQADVPMPIWPRASLLPVRPPLPGSAITDIEVLADGRLGLALASLVGPNERQAWIFDPAQASVQRIGPAVRESAPPAGEVVAPDGQHSIVLVRGAAATPNSPASADSLVLDGPKGRRPLLGDGVPGSDERVRDLSWAPDSRSALLVTQRPLVGYSTGTSLFRLRLVPLDGPTRDLVDLPIAPMEGSWVWAPDGHAVAWLVRTTPPTLATLDLGTAALRSVADVPAQLLPSQGAVAPVAWAADGTLLFVAPRPVDPAAGWPTPGPATARPLPSSVLQVLAAGRSDPHPLGDGVVVSAAPALGPNGNSLLALVAAADGTLQLETLDPHGHAVASQALGVQTTGAVSVRWDLAHAQLVLMQAAAAGGIDARVLRLDRDGVAP